MKMWFWAVNGRSVTDYATVVLGGLWALSMVYVSTIERASAVATLSAVFFGGLVALTAIWGVGRWSAERSAGRLRRFYGARRRKIE